MLLWHPTDVTVEHDWQPHHYQSLMGRISGVLSLTEPGRRMYRFDQNNPADGMVGATLAEVDVAAWQREAFNAIDARKIVLAQERIASRKRSIA